MESQELTIVKRMLEITDRIHDYVILKKDDEGYYIEYAFCEGAPHDNRCLSWYDSYQPNALRRSNPEEDEASMEKYLMARKAHIDARLGKIYELESFTCGCEENPERTLARDKDSWESANADEPFIPEDHICSPGHPAPACTQCQCRDWTYKEPVKCACWTLGREVKDINDLYFRVSVQQIKELLDSKL